MKRVAIIGAGGGGLCAAKHLLSHIGVVEPPVIYEQSNHVGGTWVYEAITPNCDEPFSSMYENLRTNLPKEVMSFPDMSHPRNLPSFLHHTEIKKYIENYAKKFKLYDHIRFQTKVDHVTPNTGGGWKVTTIENGDKENMETYDSILVCNGHYSKPYYPRIPGLKDHYKNRTTHSHYYRHPDQFSDGPQNTCFVLGIGPSALDISIELSKRFKQIILSHRSERLATKLPSNVREAYGLSHIDNDGNFICQNGTTYSEVDLFLPCTGTNLPKQVMNFPDFPFPDHEPSYLHHTVVLKYLENYTKHYNLTPHIRFQTKVMSVDPLDENQNSKWCRWSVKYQQDGCQEQQEEFDAVIVCNGHYLVPNYPEIPGLKEHYKGKQLHSHYYRDPEDHKGTKNAIVWGFGPSGRDIMLDLSPSCQKIYLCHKGERSKSEFPPNCEELLNLSHVNENGDFVTSSGDVIEDVELLVACTGYHYDFPFFSKKVDLKNENKRVMFNLYKHMFYIDHPTLSFVGIPLTIAPFPVMHQQCGYIARVISGSVNLPTTEEMWEDTVKDRKQRESENEPENYFHKLANKQFEYNDMLASLSGLPRNPPIIEKLYLYGRMFRSSYIMTYKDMEFVKIDDEHFKVLKPIEDC